MASSDEGAFSENIECLSAEKFRQSFEAMQLAEDMVDVTIKVEDTSFKAHKLILSGKHYLSICRFEVREITMR